MVKLLEKRSKLMSFLQKQKYIKLNGSTLVETLVATVLIVIIFSIASLTLNSIFKTVVKKRVDQDVRTRLNELKYLYTHKKITGKHQEIVNNWTISISPSSIGNQSIVLIEATEKSTKRIISKQFIDDRVK